MARIRTIKPEFWTDEVIVQLPYQARLLFIGLWNFADDIGAIEESPDRIRLQVLPNEPGIDVAELIDLLVAANLLVRFQDENGRRVLQVKNWAKHQKVDNPSKSRVLVENYRKLAIPSEARRAVANKYGCSPGERKEVQCYFCGSPGTIHWFKRHDGRPSAWVTFAELELDHLEPEVVGGANSAENLVLSCRPCNRGRKDKDAASWISSRQVAIPIESSPLEGKGRERKGKETTSAASRKNGSQHHKIQFDFESAKFNGIVDNDFERWQDAYPAIAVPLEVDRAAAWLKANPANKKSNYERFLVNWFTKAQDRAGRSLI